MLGCSCAFKINERLCLGQTPRSTGSFSARDLWSWFILPVPFSHEQGERVENTAVVTQQVRT